MTREEIATGRAFKLHDLVLSVVCEGPGSACGSPERYSR